jgi:copper resistance protein B
MSGVQAGLAAIAVTVAAGLGISGQAMAQDHRDHTGPPQQAGAVDHSRMDHSKMDHSKMDHSKMDHSKMDHSKMDHSKMDHSTGHGDGQAHAPTPATPIPALTDADRAAAFPTLNRHMEHASTVNSYLLFDRLEAWDEDSGTGQAWAAKGWIGTDIDRLWLRTEGERAGGQTHAADLEVLYGRSVSAWWDVVAGVRHDFAPGDSRTWAAFGVQGLAPYLFELEVTGYLGESGHTALVAEVEYELLLTNRLILQPVLEATLHGNEDAARGVGKGLSSAGAGLRLRYEINRHFAPYVGVVHERAFGDTAGLRRAADEPARDSRVVAGLRIWF